MSPLPLWLVFVYALTIHHFSTLSNQKRHFSRIFLNHPYCQMLHNVLESSYSMSITIMPSKKKKPVENPRASKMLPSPLGKKPAFPNGMLLPLKMTPPPPLGKNPPTRRMECRFSSTLHPSHQTPLSPCRPRYALRSRTRVSPSCRQRQQCPPATPACKAWGLLPFPHRQ